MCRRTFGAAILWCWLSAVVVHAEEPAVVISDLVDLSAACDAGTSERGVHGGTQSRICRTSHGTYVAYLGEVAEKQAVIHLIRIRDGRPERLLTVPTALTGSDSVQVVCDADEEVYVVAPAVESVDGKERASLSARHVDRTSGAVVEYRASVPFGRGRNYGYSSVFVDAPGRKIGVVYGGGDAPGYLAWTRFELAEKRWATEMIVADLPFRHCYMYGFADGAGGLALLAERDIRIETAGVAPTDPHRQGKADYVWDELRLFNIPDLGRPEHATVDVEVAVYDKEAGLYPTVQNNYGGDAYVDAQGRMHVLYMSTDNNHRPGSFNRHAILDAQRRLVRNELMSFQSSSTLRMFQSTAGRHYLVAMPYDQPALVQVWGAADAEGVRYELLAEKRLSDEVKPTYAGLALSCPRNGSIRDDHFDCLFPSGRSYYHFRIDLTSRDRGR
ncbi:hypothetical protein [Paludisphaera mucosa]|uniref:Uncharacterized protein n=1 Tax=Paludisphaera mucosa TaxID=3030827 RepID=A0ABT6FK75_9BACT|nr:hypothetical protein [Paludisphaera mucosa]MDG3007919.1 hypothetical protein [Paludisphaera mucosa]